MTDVALGPAVVNLIGIVQNDSWSLAMTITAGGSPMNLTGQTITAKIKTPTGSYPLTINVTNAVNGALTISQTSAPELDNYTCTWAMRIAGRTIMAGSVSGTQDSLA